MFGCDCFGLYVWIPVFMFEVLCLRLYVYDLHVLSSNLGLYIWSPVFGVVLFGAFCFGDLLGSLFGA